jgi:hypothetical protein
LSLAKKGDFFERENIERENQKRKKELELKN